MMVKSRKRLLAAMCLLCGFAPLRAEEAVERTGPKHVGRLQNDKDAWFFQTTQGKRIPLGQIAYVRFDAKATPLPKAPLGWTLLLPNQQRITGTLLRLDEKKLVFVTSWGKTIALTREQTIGVEQTALPIVRDDFENGLKAWRIEGKAALSQERAFFGKSSLLLDTASQSATREWPPARDVAIRLFFYDPATPSRLRWTFEIVPETATEKIPGIVIDQSGYVGANVKQRFASVQATAGWHLLSVEVESGRLRLFVDDACLGETTLPKKAAIKGLRIATTSRIGADKGVGKLWIDELHVVRPLPALAMPEAIADQDMAWLEHGEQLFGRAVSADADVVVLDAKFGKRSLPWSKVRGILFAKQKPPPMSAEPEILFRPGPGFPVDCLRAKLLRWEEGKLIVEHGLLGEIAIERERLDKIRFAAK